MWFFTSKPTSSSISAGISSALNATSDGDILSAYSLDTVERGGDVIRKEFVGPYGIRWTRQDAVSRKSGDRVTVFSCVPESVHIDALFVSTKHMKTLRHPNVLTWVDGTQVFTATPLKHPFRIVTERVLPLEDYLRLQADNGNFDFLASWGIYQISRALEFLNKDCQLSHNAVGVEAVYVNRSGEWKLSRLDYVCPLAEAGRQGGYSDSWLTPIPVPSGHFPDAWGLACLIWQIFNPPSPGTNGRLNTSAQITDSVPSRIPKILISDFRRLASARLTARGTPLTNFLLSGFFGNDYIKTLLFLEEIQIKEVDERQRFLESLASRVSLFPDDVCRYKILPHLVTSLKFGAAGVEALVPLLRLAHLLPQPDFDSLVLPALVTLFASPDRATRVRLLEALPTFVNQLPPTCVESKVFPSVSTGFSDANARVREATVRAMVHLAPLLSSRVLNDTLLRHLTHLQFKDEQGGIRANATVCLAKLAAHMEPNIRRGPLLNAFLRSTRDPFPPSRQAAATSLAALQAFFSTEELAGKVLPCLSFLAIDSEKEIRSVSLKALRGMLDRLEKASEDPASDEPDLEVVGVAGGTVRSGLFNAGSVAAGGLGNWALGALSSISQRLLTSTYTIASKPLTTQSMRSNEVNSSLRSCSPVREILKTTTDKPQSIAGFPSTSLPAVADEPGENAEDGDDDSWGLDKKATKHVGLSSKSSFDSCQSLSPKLPDCQTQETTKKPSNVTAGWDEEAEFEDGSWLTLEETALSDATDKKHSNSISKSIGNLQRQAPATSIAYSKDSGDDWMSADAFDKVVSDPWDALEPSSKSESWFLPPNNTSKNAKSQALHLSASTTVKHTTSPSEWSSDWEASSTSKNKSKESWDPEQDFFAEFIPKPSSVKASSLEIKASVAAEKPALKLNPISTAASAQIKTIPVPKAKPKPMAAEKNDDEWGSW